MIQNIPSLIMANFQNFKLDYIFSKDDMDVLKFYLKKDITTLLGKTDFPMFMFDSEEPELHYKCLKRDENASEILLEVEDDRYLLKGNRYGFSISNMSNPMINAVICYYNDTNSFVNELHYVVGDSVIHERQRVYANKNKGFEYKKSIKTEFGKMRYPIYQLRFISKDDYSTSYYELLSINKNKGENAIKKIIDRITSYSIGSTNTDNEHNLECIFDILEAKTISKNKSLVLKK